MKSLFILFFIMSVALFSEEKVIIDSDLTLEEAIKGTTATIDVVQSLILMNVEYYSIDNKIHRGQIVVNKIAESDLKIVFAKMRDLKFPINKMIPIVKYNWNDSSSMEDNNTSAFCYRNIAGTNRLSNHSFGLAVDINPFFNPVVFKSGSHDPKNAKYDTKRPGTFNANHELVKLFKELGWRWGGEFSKYADNHHFDLIVKDK